MPKFCVSEIRALQEAMNARRGANGSINLEDEESNERVRAAEKKVANCLRKWNSIGVLSESQKTLFEACDG